MNKKIAIEAEYPEGMKTQIEKYLDENLPDYTKNIVVTIEIVELR